MRFAQFLPRSLIALISGTTVAQIIPVAITPVLTRLYTPEEFGVLAIFVSILSVMSVIANGRYELAIILPSKNEDVCGVIGACLLICTLFSLIALLVLALFQAEISSLLQAENIGSTLYFLPLLMWLNGVYNILNYANVRQGKFKDIALSTVERSTGMAISQITFGYLLQNGAGLIYSQVVFNVLGIRRLYNGAGSYITKEAIKWLLIKRALLRYIDFLLYSLPAALANALSSNLTPILISVYFNVATLGFYSISQKMLGLPSAFIGGAMFQIFAKEGAEEYRETGKLIATFNTTLKRALIIAVPFFTLIYFIIEDAFSIIFGKEWVIAGTYAKIAIPMFASRFVVSSISAVDTIMEKQKYFLIFNLVLLIVTLIVIYLFKGKTFDTFLGILSWTTALIYLLYGCVLRKLSQG